MALDERNIVVVGEHRWPPGEGGGKADLSINGSLNNKVQEANGKDDAKITITGKKVPDIELKITWITAPSSNPTEDDARTFVDAVGPFGPNSGKPFELTHPDAPWYGVTSVIFLEQGKIERGEGQASITLKGKGWKKPKPVGGDGKAQTPNDPQKWHQNGLTKKVGSNNNTVGGFGNEGAADTPPEVKP
ncbi:MAG TPA: hypothetical protein PKA64_01570 [Myxococcota bacterium]|nr:hypothetical protein [Myxococcota bacterium]